MDSIKSYSDLCIDIDNLEEYLQNLERELYAVRRVMGPEVYKKDFTTFDKAYDRFNEIERKMAIYSQILEDKKKTRKKILKNLRKLKGLDYKVVYLRDIKGLTLQKISEKLNYSLRHIERISARNKRIDLSLRCRYRVGDLKENA